MADELEPIREATEATHTSPRTMQELEKLVAESMDVHQRLQTQLQVSTPSPSTAMGVEEVTRTSELEDDDLQGMLAESTAFSGPLSARGSFSRQSSGFSSTTPRAADMHNMNIERMMELMQVLESTLAEATSAFSSDTPTSHDPWMPYEPFEVPHRGSEFEGIDEDEDEDEGEWADETEGEGEAKYYDAVVGEEKRISGATDETASPFRGRREGAASTDSTELEFRTPEAADRTRPSTDREAADPELPSVPVPELPSAAVPAHGSQAPGTSQVAPALPPDVGDGCDAASGITRGAGAAANGHANGPRGAAGDGELRNPGATVHAAGDGADGSAPSADVPPPAEVSLRDQPVALHSCDASAASSELHNGLSHQRESDPSAPAEPHASALASCQPVPPSVHNGAGRRESGNGSSRRRGGGGRAQHKSKLSVAAATPEALAAASFVRSESYP